jgi:hypothetical protein
MNLSPLYKNAGQGSLSPAFDTDKKLAASAVTNQ